MIPNFFILGAPKCGTTALSSYLAEHPNVFMSLLKEPQFFNTDFVRRYERSWSSYLGLYAGADPGSHRVIGEASTGYLVSQAAVPNILERCGRAKFIVMVRNPIEMCHARHGQLLFNGVEDIVEFESAWRAQTDRAQGRRIPRSCVEPKILMHADWGRVGAQLERLFDRVPRETVKVIVFDDFVKDTRTVYADTLRFLDVPADGRSHFPKMNESMRVLSVRRQEWLVRALLVGVRIREGMGLRRSLGIGRRALLWNAEVAPRSPLHPRFVSELRDFFREDVEKLGQLLDRDLSHWAGR